jgi:hypothetical protein
MRESRRDMDEETWRLGVDWNGETSEWERLDFFGGVL